MANVEHLLTGSSINGENLFKAGPQEVTILNAETVTYDDGDKVKLSFEETDKQLTLNKTRLSFMIGNFGPDTDNWIGQKVVLHAQQLTSGKFSGQFSVLITRPVQSSTSPTEDEVPF